MNINGLTMNDWQSFNDMLVKANEQQLKSIAMQVLDEKRRRGL